MATKKSTAPQSAADQAGAYAPAEADPRCKVALDAAWQIEGLFDALIEQGVRAGDVAELAPSAIIRALAIRGKDLNSAVMSMLNETERASSIDEARAIVAHGQTRPEVDHAEG